MTAIRMEIRYIKSVDRLLNRDCVNRRGSDLSKEVLWISVGHLAAELLAVKVGDQNNSAAQPSTGESGSNWAKR